ncbi:MAG: beta/gamma crystallin-related protein [Betaproteobacteria bacterium]
MNRMSRISTGVAAVFFAGVASAQVTLYGAEGMRGPAFTASGPVGNLQGSGFNDRAGSMIVQRGQWEVCEDANFRGDCRTVRPGQYPSLAALGLGNEISSLRPLRGKARYQYAPAPVASNYQNYQYYPRASERTYQANVTSVRAVVGAPEQRCWVERERVGSSGNIGGAIVGGILGGVLGHQIGGGHGQDVATAVGAVGGAAIGSNVAGGRSSYTQDVRHCETVSGNMQPAYWDVTYTYRGQPHRAQLANPPGPTIAVNGNGEPRV